MESPTANNSGFTLANDKGWVEVSFESPTNQSIELTAKMVHSYDYGIYRVLLDGEQIALAGPLRPGHSSHRGKTGDAEADGGNPYFAIRMCREIAQVSGIFSGV